MNRITTRNWSNPVKIQNYESSPQQPVTMEGSVGCKVRWLIGNADQAPNFAMRQFEVTVGGNTPKHFHPYEHEVFVLRGHGQIIENDQTHPIQAGDCIFAQTGFTIRTDQPLEFLYLIPIRQSTNSDGRSRYGLEPLTTAPKRS
jgi:quercetin dioxygenase-like cupin family protein